MPENAQGANQDPKPDETPEQGAGNGTDESVILTAEELSARLQKEGDRRVQQANAKFEERLEQRLTERLDQERKRAEQERQKEQGEYQELARQFETENATLKAEKAAADLRAKTSEMLADEKLPELMPFFGHDTSTIEGRAAMVGSLKTVIDEAVERSVNERLRTSKAPPGPKGQEVAGSDQTRGDRWAAFYRTGPAPRA